MAIYSGKDMPKEAWPTSRAINALTGNNPIMSDCRLIGSQPCRPNARFRAGHQNGGSFVGRSFQVIPLPRKTGTCTLSYLRRESWAQNGRKTPAI